MRRDCYNSLRLVIRFLKSFPTSRQRDVTNENVDTFLVVTHKSVAGPHKHTSWRSSWQRGYTAVTPWRASVRWLDALGPNSVRVIALGCATSGLPSEWRRLAVPQWRGAYGGIGEENDEVSLRQMVPESRPHVIDNAIGRTTVHSNPSDRDCFLQLHANAGPNSQLEDRYFIIG